MSESVGRQLGRAWDRMEEWIILLLLAYMAVSLNVEVVKRYAFSISSPYAGEIARLCLIWIVFLGIPYAIRCRAHIVIDIISGRIDERTDLIVRIISDSIFALFCVALTVLGSITVIELRRSGVETDALEMPKWIAFIGIPIGAMLGFARLMQQLVGDIRVRFNTAES